MINAANGLSSAGRFIVGECVEILRPPTETREKAVCLGPRKEVKAKRCAEQCGSRL